MIRPPVSPELRQLVSARAKERCEYCLLAEQDTTGRHVVDHVIAIKHHGATESDNLALACVSCNGHKGSDIAAIDPESGQLVPLFNPRYQVWDEHFTLEGARIVGLTPIGRGTTYVLQLNEPNRLQLRAGLIEQGRYPPD